MSSFIKGINSNVPIASTILEKIFALMDKNEIGLVDYEKFSCILNIETTSQIPKNEQGFKDDFNWQEQTIERIKKWARQNNLNATESFKSFDKDLNGQIDKAAMKKGLEDNLGMPASEITATRLDRLFKLMSFYKTETIQQSDFDRLFEDANPY